MSRQAFIEGFLKRAAQYGYTRDAQLSKAAEKGWSTLHKQAFVGPATDIALKGLPSIAGAMLGANYAPINTKELKEELMYHEDPSISKALKYMLVPGYTGYRAAKTRRLDRAYQKYRDETDSPQS